MGTCISHGSRVRRIGYQPRVDKDGWLSTAGQGGWLSTAGVYGGSVTLSINRYFNIYINMVFTVHVLPCTSLYFLVLH